MSFIKIHQILWQIVIFFLIGRLSAHQCKFIEGKLIGDLRKQFFLQSIKSCRGDCCILARDRNIHLLWMTLIFLLIYRQSRRRQWPWWFPHHIWIHFEKKDNFLQKFWTTPELHKLKAAKTNCIYQDWMLLLVSNTKLSSLDLRKVIYKRRISLQPFHLGKKYNGDAYYERQSQFAEELGFELYCLCTPILTLLHKRNKNLSVHVITVN